MSTFAAGQVWSMKAAPSPQTRIVIGKVEKRPGEAVIHVAILNVPVPQDIAPDAPLITIGHSPFTEEAFARSVGALLQEKASLPDDFNELLEAWSEDEGEAAYTITAAESLSQIFQAIREG